MSQIEPTGPRAAKPRWLPLTIIAVGAIAGFVLLRDQLSFDALRDNREDLLAFRDAHFALASLTFMAAYIAIVAFSLPGATIATLTGGFLFGVFPGTLFNVLAAGTGACLLFLAARAGLGQHLAARIDATEGRIQRLKAGLDRNVWSMLIVMRLVPAVPFFVANLLPALLGVRFVPFMVTTYGGIIPGALIYTSVGAGLGAVFESGERPDLGVIFQPEILLPILGLAALALAPALYKVLRKAKDA